jgi:hypothetical protein
MARRLLILVMRIVLLALLLLGPLLAVVAAVLLVPSAPNPLKRTLLLVAGIWLFSAILLAPAVLFRDSGWPGPADGDEGGGGGGPPPAPLPPAPPRGGIPLPDADQASIRLRDHGRAGWRRLRPRRAAREQKPARAPSPHR